MRKALAIKDGERKKFSGIFRRFGSRANYHGFKEETVLLVDVVDLESNTRVADHLWFPFSKGFQEAGLVPGKTVTFDARIKKYVKGYVNTKYKIDRRKNDYKLSYPTHIKVT
jgi:hypothetical protein